MVHLAGNLAVRKVLVIVTQLLVQMAVQKELVQSLAHKLGNTTCRDIE